MEKFKNYLLLFMLLGTLVLAVGCTNSNSSEESDKKSQGQNEEAKTNVRSVLEKIFTGPNEEQVKLLDPTGDMEEYNKKLTNYYQEDFKPHMSDAFYESHIIKLNGAIRFLQAAYPKYILEVNEITLEEREAKEGDYHFNVEVTYTNKDSDERDTMNIEGTASTNEEGKITSIRYTNDEEFRDYLQ
ncbi:hypothetical protein [Guptibacillus algicola]|uniref:hypothetical protein n=1 Tax=Guptibacillus algicola TaxID=225844 RepID=UPI001CD4BA89|nr:hypothetical protein [Alkalihalobacillus algicola]MCA0986504.1 hypothetical protein [Alkalihalobacillus algicola]